jgi:hypothetical protein
MRAVRHFLPRFEPMNPLMGLFCSLHQRAAAFITKIEYLYYGRLPAEGGRLF